MVTYDSDTNMATVTLTTYAQKTLGDVVFVELISVGENVKQGGKLFVNSGGTVVNECYNSRNWHCRER